MPYADPERQRQYQRERCARIRAEFFAGKRCACCGTTDQLELDHIDPSKKVSHNIWSWSPARRETELVKCQVLCHDCHLEKTIASYTEPEHGVNRYKSKKHRCRCEICRAAKRVEMQERRLVASQ